jgi:tRNA A-37 threonylcarbamoyl transferase component Bud32/tetratricopeptide (TPR) repeat protein
VHGQGPLIEEDDHLGDSAASIPPDRYRLVRELGHGAFGTVYEAVDRRRNARVALKILEIQDAEARYRFKREFRALARLSHPNLVTLYELHAAEEPWYFTMELVDGVDFAADGEQRAEGSGRDFNRLRTSTRQLVRAVLALHQAGMLHCDIKPSNVLVTPAGRVVVLDFGLVTDLDTSAALAERTHPMVGTPAYMSPEQCSGAPLTPASDWYAVGVVLYEALTGALPHDGHSLQILTGKREAAPRPIHELAPDVPPDLAAVCMELLDADPAARPSGIALLRRLDRRRVKRENTGSPVGHVRADTDTDTSTDAAEPFVGRIHERTLLDQALARSQQGHAQVVLIGGSSGMGKTALARHYLDALARTGEILVVTGACYPREFVPYKGLDSLIDGLARALAGMREDELRAVTPADIRALSRLFPVLSRLHAYAPLVELPPLQGDLRELRRRAFDTLRLLVLRLATARPVVLFIDDLQWMDAEALAWLGHVLGPPGAPPLLFIGTYERSDAAQEHPARSLIDRLGDSRGDELGERLGRRPGNRTRESQATGPAAPATPADMVLDIALGPLDAADAQEAAEALLGSRTSAEMTALAASVADAASGHPFLLVQLATYVEGEPAAALRDGSGTAVTVSEAVERMLARLSPTARRLLELIAVAGRPVPQSAVADAAALKVHEVDVLAPLSTARLVRPLEIAGHDYVDVYLDCIREAVLAGLDGSHLARHHRRLAHALLRFGAPAEWLHVHFRGAGEYARAAQFAEEAGDKAALALAFERAAACYRDAIALGSQSARLHEKLGDALAHGGRGREAADAYLTALQVSPPARVPELRRRAAEQLLRIGHLERGLAELGTVLADVGLRLRSRWGALAYTACRRAWLYVRGLSFIPRAAKDCDPQVLLELDACWSASTLLSMVDTIQGAHFHGRHLHKALVLGERMRVARALASEVVYTAAPGHRKRERARALVTRAADMAARLGNVYLSAFSLLVEGVAVFLADHDWPRAVEILERAEDALRERCVGVDWERDSAMLFTLNGLFWLGAFDEIARRHPVLMERARARGDLYAQDALESAFLTPVLLAADRPDELRQRQYAFAARRGGSASALTAWWSFVALCEADLYEGHGLTCVRRISDTWSRFARSPAFRVQVTRMVARFLRGRAALCAAVEAPRGMRGRWLRWQARRDARYLDRQGTPWTMGLAGCIRAGLAVQRGDLAAAQRWLDSARQDLERSHTFLVAHAVRYCQGALRGNDAGRAQMDEAARLMAEVDIQAPERVVRWLLPGVLPAQH